METTTSCPEGTALLMDPGLRLITVGLPLRAPDVWVLKAGLRGEPEADDLVSQAFGAPIETIEPKAMVFSLGTALHPPAWTDWVSITTGSVFRQVFSTMSRITQAWTVFQCACQMIARATSDQAHRALLVLRRVFSSVVAGFADHAPFLIPQPKPLSIQGRDVDASRRDYNRLLGSISAQGPPATDNTPLGVPVLVSRPS